MVPDTPHYFSGEMVLDKPEKKSLIKKILHVIVTLLPMAVFMVIYMPVFFWVESLNPAGGFHIIHTALDDMIPVVEAFVIPYFLWFPYLGAGMIAIAVRSRSISRKTAYMLMTGMSLFIVISVVYPNALELRSAIPDRQNICILSTHRLMYFRAFMFMMRWSLQLVSTSHFQRRKFFSLRATSWHCL